MELLNSLTLIFYLLDKVANLLFIRQSCQSLRISLKSLIFKICVYILSILPPFSQAYLINTVVYFFVKIIQFIRR